MQPRKHRLSFAFVLLACSPLQTVVAQVPQADVEPHQSKPPMANQTAEPPLIVTKLKIHPAPVSMPSIRYYFTPRPIDQQDGNAALYYLNAVVLMSELGNNPKEAEAIDEIYDDESGPRPWDKQRIEKAETTLARFSPVLDQVRLGAMQRNCDWGTNLSSYFVTPIRAEFRQLRAIARLLTARIRLDLARGDIDQAAANLQVSLTYARHIADGFTLVHALVGVAIDGLMVSQIWEMMRHSDCPNLYWSITAIPSPPVSIRRGLDVDADGVYLIFPKLRNLATQRRSSLAWSELLQETLDWFFKPENRGLGASESPWLKDLPRTSEQMIEKYGRKSIEFLKTRGYDQAELAKMPEAKAVLLHTTIRWNEVLDQTFRWSYLPYWQAYPHLSAIDAKMKSEGQSPIPLAESLAPAVVASTTAHARLSRQFAALRVIEAIRDYAARHDGQLPKSLDDIKDLPLPIDPYTGKSFEYRLENGKAILDGPSPDGSKGGIHAMRWEIELVPPAK